MPYFDENPLAGLALQPDAAEAELDLRGLPPEYALRRVDEALRAPDRPGSLLIRFDPASDDGRETLFLPLGRWLLAARREGRLQRCLPLADGSAYFVVLSTA